MDPSSKSSDVEALRIGLDPSQVRRFSTPMTRYPETLIIRSSDEQAPLMICLHPPRLDEFQFAQRLRDLTQLPVHLAFPKGPHPHLVDLGGARTVGHDWCHYTGNNPSFHKSLEDASEHFDAVVARTLEELPVDRRRIFLLGAEGTSLFASLYGVAHTTTFAGIITISGQTLPDLIAETMSETERIPFLCLSRRRSRGFRREENAARIPQLEALGFPVDHVTLLGDKSSWEEETEHITAWLTEKADLPVVLQGEFEE